MDTAELQERYLPVLKHYFIPIVLGVIRVMFLGYGLITLFSHKQDPKDILFQAASDTSPLMKSSISPATSDKQISVDVEGAVQHPGVYALNNDSRVQDGLIAAGGLGNNADREQVAKGLNLAAKLTDGAKIYIPVMGEQQTLASNGQNVLGGETSAVININSASPDQLDSLPGVGAVTAQKIISNRPYATIDGLTEKKAVSMRVFEQIKDKISVY